MTTVLQIKLREVLREDLAGTYGVWVGGSVSQFPDQEYHINLGSGCDPERVEELTQVIFTQIDSLQKFGTTDLYIDKVKEMRQREVDLKENGFWINVLKWTDSHGIDPRLLLESPKLVDSLTSEAVQAAAKRYFNMDNYVRVVLYPEDMSEQ